MSIDDPLEAGKSVLAADERAESPVTPFLKAPAPLVPGVPGNLLRSFLQQKQDENLKFMFTVMRDELVRVRNIVEQRTPSESQVECVCEDWLNSSISAEVSRSKSCMVIVIYPQHSTSGGLHFQEHFQAHLVLKTNPHFRLIVHWK